MVVPLIAMEDLLNVLRPEEAFRTTLRVPEVSLATLAALLVVLETIGVRLHLETVDAATLKTVMEEEEEILERIVMEEGRMHLEDDMSSKIATIVKEEAEVDAAEAMAMTGEEVETKDPETTTVTALLRPTPLARLLRDTNRLLTTRRRVLRAI